MYPLVGLLPTLFSLSSVEAQPINISVADLTSPLASIIVYASRFEEKLADALPQTTIVTAAEIQKSSASNVSEVLAKVAGLPVRINLDGSTNAVIDMRGYGDTASNNVVVLLDGVRLSENEQAIARTSMIPLEAIDHIEITRTGNSVLYGDGANGGTINIVTKKMVGELTVVSGGLASYSGIQSGIYHARPLESSELSLFSRQYTSDNYRKNSKGTELSAGANWIKKIDSQTDIGARFFASRERNKLPGALPSVQLNSSPRDTQVPDYTYDAHVDSRSLTLFGKTTVGDVELAIDLNKRIRDNSDAYDYDAAAVFAGYNLYPNWRQAYGNSSAHVEVDATNPRAKIKNFLHPNNALQVGYDWLKSTKSGAGYKTNSAYNIDDPSDPWTYWPYKIDNSNYRYTHQSSGVYARNIFDASPTDRMVLGYRKEQYSQNYLLNYYSDNDPAFAPGRSSYTGKGSVSANELEYVKKLNAMTVAYLRLARNFRVANPDDNSNAFDANFALSPLRPQISKDFDAGLHYRSGVTQMELSFFDSRVQNEIGYDPSKFSNINFDRTKRHGLDFRQRLSLSKDLALRAHLQYLSASFSEGPYSGKTVPGVTALSGHLSVDYQMSPKEQVTLTTRGAQSRYMSGDFSNSQAKVPGYTVEDLSYFYKEKNWSLVASIINVTNKKYTDTGIYKSNYTSPYTMTVYPNPGRNFSLTGRYLF